MNPTLRIAAADDEARMREYYLKILPHLGHEVTAVARTGRELVEHCCAARPDLVITDVKMPDMDGIDAANEICRGELIPFIVVSAYHDPELLQRTREDGIFAYLIKPIKQADLEAAITVAMQRYEQFRMVSREAEGLRQALEDRKILERAKGLLMKQAGLDEEQAFRRLQKLARDGNRKMIDVARALLSLEAAFEPPAAAAD